MKEKVHLITDWLPTTAKEMEAHGWSELDVILISGDAYVDHPSFGHAVIGRIIQAEGWRVGIIAQPNWRDDLREFKKFGKPRYFFAITSGCMDSMMNHYTANRRLRSTDAYTAGGKAGFRPDYATTVYSQIVKKLYPDVPVIIGGIEASLRRFTHYDYWKDSLLPSILADSQADLLIYGMGEKPLRTIIQLMQKNVPFSSLTTIPQTALLLDQQADLPKNKHWQTVELASYEACLADKMKFAANFKIIEQESNRMISLNRLIENIGSQRVIVNPPFPLLNEKEMDEIYNLPFTRLPHPKYHKRGDIPAFEMIKFSITMHRGCFGGCSFCTISAHQGKMIASRSADSILKEVAQITDMPGFKGYISDLGGPTANMYRMKGIDLALCQKCKSASCIYPKICRNLDSNHRPLIEIYKKVNSFPGIKKAFVSSGIRYDLFISDNQQLSKKNHYREYFEQLVLHHVSGRIKVAPEHSSERTLKLMRKPSFQAFRMFTEKFRQFAQRRQLNLQIVPYFISGHPGCEITDMADLAIQTKEMGFRLEQVQDFTPTPMTLASVMYYCGIHPYHQKPFFVAKSNKEKQLQKIFLLWYKKASQPVIKNELTRLKRPDLIKKLFQN